MTIYANCEKELLEKIEEAKSDGFVHRSAYGLCYSEVEKKKGNKWYVVVWK